MPTKDNSINTPDFRVALKVKAKSLADEAKIIRKEEGRAKSWYDMIQLKEHRRTVVRYEARSALLAYGFLRGTPYRTMEPSTKPGNEPDWKRVRQLIHKYIVPNHWITFSEVTDLRNSADKRFAEWKNQ